MKYRVLKRIALSIGWKEVQSRGKGSERLFKRKNYASVLVRCHGEGDELSWNDYVVKILEPLEDVCISPRQINSIKILKRKINVKLHSLQDELETDYGIEELRETLPNEIQDHEIKKDKRIDILLDELSDLENERNAYKEEIKKKKDQLKILEEDYSNFKNRNIDFQNKLKTITDQIDSKNIQLKSLEAKITKNTSDQKSLEVTLQELLLNIETRKKEFDDINRKILLAKKINHDLDQENRHMRDKISLKSDEMQRLTRQANSKSFVERNDKYKGESKTYKSYNPIFSRLKLKVKPHKIILGIFSISSVLLIIISYYSINNYIDIPNDSQEYIHDD